MNQKSIEGRLLWQPSEEWIQQSNISQYMKWLKDKKNLKFNDYEELWEWSVKEIELFWATIWEFFDVQSTRPYQSVLSQRKMPGATWFTGAKLNYAEHIFRHSVENQTAIISKSELRPLQNMSWQELYEDVAAFANSLKTSGIKAGDLVVAFLPNIPEAVVAFLACASIGAIWSSCSPDFGSPTVIDRFKQIEPKLLLTVDGYRYKGQDFDNISRIKEIQDSIPTLVKTVLLTYLNPCNHVNNLNEVILWDNFVNNKVAQKLEFEQLPFDHPLWVLFSSGTTGLPKAIVQGHGGILLEHLKQCSLHLNLKQGDRFFWYTTTGWMMWNMVVSGLLTGSAIILFDGHPSYPKPDSLWGFAEETGMTMFGTSASYLLSCQKEGVKPKNNFNLKKLKSIGSTGSPLPSEGYNWVYKDVKKDLWLSSISGGTDVCSAFVGGAPILPVYSGEIQCRSLGAKVEAFDEDGNLVQNKVGELVILEPMPSMPLYFWNDIKNERYKNSYFDHYPGVWRHGDWIKISSRASCQIFGRSDSTINRGGIRIGTSELYSTVESMESIADSLAVDVSYTNENPLLLLFVVLKPNAVLDKKYMNEIKQHIKKNCSPRHIPDHIFQINEVPRTLNGKKIEIPVKRILMGVPIEKAINVDSISNPHAIDFFIGLQNKLKLN